MSPIQRTAGLRGARFQAVSARSRSAGVGWTLWGFLPHFLPRLGSGTKAIASAAVAVGALRASRRSDGTIKEALMVIHRTLKEMPGPQAEMSAVIAHWDPANRELALANCGHVPPVVIRNDGTRRKAEGPEGPWPRGRSAPEPAERSTTLAAGDRLIMVSDSVVSEGKKKAGLGIDGLLEAAQHFQGATDPGTVREIDSAVLDATGGDLDDDATAVCLAITQP